MNEKIYKMDTYEGLPRICIYAGEDEQFYIALKKNVHGRYFLTEHRVTSDGRFLDQWNVCDAKIKDQNYSTLVCIIGFFIANCYTAAFADYINTIEYDGADTEEDEPDNDFIIFVDSVYEALE